jgi:hypothetical protein
MLSTSKKENKLRYLELCKQYQQCLANNEMINNRNFINISLELHMLKGEPGIPRQWKTQKFISSNGGGGNNHDDSQ